jgi:hypothetical protein
VPRPVHATSHRSSPSGCQAAILPNPCRLRKNASTAGQNRPFIIGSIFGSPWRSNSGAICHQRFGDCDKRRATLTGVRPSATTASNFVTPTPRYSAAWTRRETARSKRAWKATDRIPPHRAVPAVRGGNRADPQSLQKSIRLSRGSMLRKQLPALSCVARKGHVVHQTVFRINHGGDHPRLV